MIKEKLKIIKKLNMKVFFWAIVLTTISFSVVNKLDAQGLLSTPSDNNVFQVIPGDVVEQMYGCNVDLPTGMIPGLFEAAGSWISGAKGNEILCDATNFNTTGDVSHIEKYFASDRRRGAFEGIMQINAMILDQRPASGIDFIEQKIYALQNVGNVQAQENPDAFYNPGPGYDWLRPMQGFWGWSVNIVYGVLILIVIFVAFGIMFRAQIPGGVAITLQNSIPNIALAMILVPLSYAITGLFIDGITIGSNVVHQFLVGPGAPGRDVFRERNEEFPRTGRIGGMIEDRGLRMDDQRVSWIYSSSYVNLTDEIGDGLPAYFMMFFGAGIGHDIFDAIIGLLAPLVNFAIGFMLLFTGLRIFWLLVKKYIGFAVTGPLLSPFAFATVAFPGGGFATVMQYVKMMGSGTLYYVVAYAMTLLSMILASDSFKMQLAQAGLTSYYPPILGIDLAGGGGLVDNNVPAFLMAVVALGIYLSIPGALKSIDESLGVDNSLIPAFAMPVWQSAKDSINLAKATASKVKATANLPSTLNNNRLKAMQSLRNLADRARGRTPGEQNTSAFRRSQKLDGEIAELEKRRQNAIANGNSVQARILATRLNGKRREMESIKTSLGEGAGKLADIKSGAMKVDIEWNGQKMPIKFGEHEILAHMRSWLGPAGAVPPEPNPVITMGGGSITLSIENAKFTPDILKRLAIHHVDIPNNNDRRSGTFMRAGDDARYGSDFRTTEYDRRSPARNPRSFYDASGRLVPITIPFLEGDAQIMISHTSIDPNDDMTVVRFKFDIINANIRTLFNTTGVGSISPTKQIATDRFRFRLSDIGSSTGDIDSNEFKVEMGSSYFVSPHSFRDQIPNPGDRALLGLL